VPLDGFQFGNGYFHFLGHGRHQRAQLQHDRIEFAHQFEMLVGGDRIAAYDALVDLRTAAQPVSQVVSPGVHGIQRQGEGKGQGQNDADQDVHGAPQAIADGVVPVPRDDEQGDRRKQRGVAAFADRMIGEETAGAGHQYIRQPGHLEVVLLGHDGQAQAGADQCAIGAFHRFFADVAMMLQATDHNQ
jgi:hypothetical protein